MRPPDPPPPPKIDPLPPYKFIRPLPSIFAVVIYTLPPAPPPEPNYFYMSAVPY